MKFRVLGVLMVTAAAMGTAACDGDGDGQGGAGGGGAGGTGGNTTTTSMMMVTTTSAPMTTTTGTPTMEACTDLGTFEECADCLLMENPGGYQAFAEALVGSCGCAMNAPCIAECDTMDPATDTCGPPLDVTIANQACVMCINNLDAMSACLADFQTACSNDPDCVDFVTELQGCPQN